MIYPQELREHTEIQEKDHPFHFFFNEHPAAKSGGMILHLHWHEHFEIIVMQQGRAIFHIDSRPYDAQPGDVLLVPGGGLHVGYSACEGELAYLSIVFNRSLFQSWAHDPVHRSYILPYLEGSLALPVKPSLTEPACTGLSALLEEAASEFKAKRPAYQLIIASQLHMLLTLLARTYLPQQTPITPSKALTQHRDRFKSLIRHIEATLSDKHTVAEAARHMNLNPYHFCKLFKKLTGQTFIEYVNVCRVREAERLLLESDLSITEIAGRIGCDNPNSLTKLFKQHKGMTPSQFRKRGFSQL
ncbi:AraC family transcriptional regulator [Paenibacillus filicis]|uniref:AraC family transcriptional regulator n=1 Tax=Paenibacillus filicis TaxID=669464 RepID=A0ABU9DMZ3_9BACL